LGEEASSFNPPSPPPLRKGLVQLFTGDGKGKTSAAIGAVVRALGHGLRVYMALFMKGDYPYGERKILSGLSGVTLESFGTRQFIDPDNIKPEEIEQAKRALAAARQAMLSGEYDLVVLDEVNLAVAFNLLRVNEVLALIEAKPEGVELILTGRQADRELVRVADLVTECLKIKHPYDSGVGGREGFEY
jgi:cob(I)alamin adenosyltransferase